MLVGLDILTRLALCLQWLQRVVSRRMWQCEDFHIVGHVLIFSIFLRFRVRVVLLTIFQEKSKVS